MPSTPHQAALLNQIYGIPKSFHIWQKALSESLLPAAANQYLSKSIPFKISLSLIISSFVNVRPFVIYDPRSTNVNQTWDPVRSSWYKSTVSSIRLLRRKDPPVRLQLSL